MGGLRNEPTKTPELWASRGFDGELAGRLVGVVDAGEKQAVVKESDIVLFEQMPHREMEAAEERIYTPCKAGEEWVAPAVM